MENLEKVELLNNYIHASKHYEEAMNYIDALRNGTLKPLLTSIEVENKKLRGFLPTDHITIAGRSGMGKTSRMLALIKDFLDEKVNPHYKGNIVILYDSWEISGWRNIIKMMGSHTDMTSSDILNYEERLNDEKYKMLSALKNEFSNSPLYISEFSDDIPKWVERKKAARKHFKDKLIVNVIDHTRLVTGAAYQSEEKNLSSFMKASIDVKKRYNSINIFLSQMNRNIETSVDREKIGTNLPVSSDIFGSDSVYQGSDTVIGLHRPGFYGLKEFNIDGTVLTTGLTENSTDNLLIETIMKNRNGDIGNLAIGHDIKYNKFFKFKPIQINPVDMMFGTSKNAFDISSYRNKK